MSRDLGAQGRSVAYHPDGTQVSVGLAGGGIVVLSSDSLDTVHLRKDRDQPVGALKYSPDGQYLAVGSDENTIDIYDISKQYARIGVCKGHSTKVVQLDWSTDSALLQSGSSNHELLFWEMPTGTQAKFPHDLRNVDWFTWSSVVGWPVQGIIPPTSAPADVTCCDRSAHAHRRRRGDARRRSRLPIPVSPRRHTSLFRRAHGHHHAVQIPLRRFLSHHRRCGHDDLSMESRPSRRAPSRTRLARRRPRRLSLRDSPSVLDDSLPTLARVSKNCKIPPCMYVRIIISPPSSRSRPLLSPLAPAPSTVPPRVGRGSTRHTSPMDHAYVLCAAFPSSRGASEIRATGNPAAVVVVENDEEDDAGDFVETNRRRMIFSAWRRRST